MTATRSTKTAAPRKPTSVKEWKKAQAEPVELPSGFYMRVRRMSMPTLMATGKMPNSLMSVVQSAIDRGTGMAGVEDKMADLMGDQEKLREMGRFMDDLVVMVALEPKVHPNPPSEEERDEDLLYADDVDQEDKSFIFQLVTGGTSDLERFRRESEANVAAVSGRSNLVVPAVGTASSD